MINKIKITRLISLSIFFIISISLCHGRNTPILLNETNYKQSILDLKSKNQSVILRLYWDSNGDHLVDRLIPFPEVVVRGIDCRENIKLCEKVSLEKNLSTIILLASDEYGAPGIPIKFQSRDQRNKEFDDLIREIFNILGIPVNIVELTLSNAQEVVYNSNKSVLVQIHYQWNNYDKFNVPTFERLSARYSNVPNFVVARAKCCQFDGCQCDQLDIVGKLYSQSIILLYSAKRQQCIIYNGYVCESTISEFIQDEIDGNEFKSHYNTTLLSNNYYC
ncbi:hypothetical protein PPL_04491 [Heterostelium album PN500]|uniref:Uncharacterized protein n=1 Tax=Heterostelium pallidum (strain ATCC 26659 / Pp 5 / PN500) TaxID=670386 RepID=D3B7Q3_HETP5|nr:hypothetical protein PPL_04491 [Heterostelium album PN500]EFA82796.1 hypothetical protein PPL_04491 [Heterostelium album PN500]|eukprot:XP_020434913.1 hypothetical protein PPL_04491 [Heterostelium album PN500]